jgi:hypothetical protein
MTELHKINNIKHDKSAHIHLEHHDPTLKTFCITSYIFLDKVKTQLRTSIIVYLMQNLVIKASYIVKTKRQGKYIQHNRCHTFSSTIKITASIKT